MRILFIADPESIHDIRWINFLSRERDVKSFVIIRKVHFSSFDPNKNRFNKGITILGSIGDHSTVRPWLNWCFAHRIKQLIDKHEIDLLHILYAEPSSLWGRWKWYFGVPIVVTTHGSDILRTIPAFFDGSSYLRKAVSRTYKKALNRVDHITCTSLRQIDVLSALGITTETTLVRTGVDFGVLMSSRKDPMALSDNKPLIFMPRNMRPVYNHELTLEAIRMLPEQLRSGFAFIFVNSDTFDTVYVNGLRKRAASITADIRFLPSLPNQEIGAVYRRARLVVMNPLSDGSPVTAMEAMACKVPVILPPLAYDKDLFGNCFFFEEWSAKSLAAKIEEVLLFSQESMTRHVNVNHERILQQASIESQMDKIHMIYQALIVGQS